MWGLKKLAISSLPSRAHSLASWPTAGGFGAEIDHRRRDVLPLAVGDHLRPAVALRYATAELVVPRSMPTKVSHQAPRCGLPLVARLQTRDELQPVGKRELIDDGGGVVNGFLDLLEFWLIDVAGISVKCRVRRQVVGCILPRAESSLDLGGFLKKQSEVMRFRGLLIPEGQISLQCLLRGLLAMVNCYIENRAIGSEALGPQPDHATPS